MKSFTPRAVSACVAVLLVCIALLCLSERSHSTPRASVNATSTLLPGEHYVLGASVILPARIQRLEIRAGHPILPAVPNSYQTQTTNFVPEEIKITPDVLSSVLQTAPCITSWLAPVGSPALAFRANPLGVSDFETHPDAEDGLVSYFTDHEPKGDRHYGVSYPDQARKKAEPGDLTAFMPASNDRVELGVVPGSSSAQIVARVEEDGSLLLFVAQVP